MVIHCSLFGHKFYFYEKKGHSEVALENVTQFHHNIFDGDATGIMLSFNTNFQIFKEKKHFELRVAHFNIHQ